MCEFLTLSKETLTASSCLLSSSLMTSVITEENSDSNSSSIRYATERIVWPASVGIFAEMERFRRMLASLLRLIVSSGIIQCLFSSHVRAVFALSTGPDILVKILSVSPRVGSSLFIVVGVPVVLALRAVGLGVDFLGGSSPMIGIRRKKRGEVGVEAISAEGA